MTASLLPWKDLAGRELLAGGARLAAAIAVMASLLAASGAQAAAANPATLVLVSHPFFDGWSVIDVTSGRQVHRIRDPAYPLERSPDGSRVAYGCSASFGSGDVCVERVDGRSRRMVVASPGGRNGGTVFDIDWSADGRELAVGWEDAAWIVRADGAGHRPLPTGGDQNSPFWSPRGSELAYARDLPGPNPAEGIYVVPRNGGPPRRVSGGSLEAYPLPKLCGGCPALSRPIWSPRGSLIAYLQDSRGTGKDGVYVVRRDGSQRHQVSTLPDRHDVVGVYDRTISWSPDERSITYTAESPNPSDAVAFTVDMATGRRTRLGQGLAMFSPRRGQILLRDSGGRLTLMHGDGRSKAVLAERTHVVAWSLDGSRIAYTRRDGLWVVDVANHKARRILRWRVPPRYKDDVASVVWSHSWTAHG